MAWSAIVIPITGQLITAGFWQAQISDNLTILKTSMDNNGHLAYAAAYKTATYALTATDDTILADPTAGTFTLSLPVGGPGTGTNKRYDVKHYGSANQVVIDAGANFIDLAHTFTLEVPMQSQTIQWSTQFLNWVLH